MIGTEDHNVMVVTKNHVVIDVYDLGCSVPSSNEMFDLDHIAKKKGLLIQIIDVSEDGELGYSGIVRALEKI